MKKIIGALFGAMLVALAIQASPASAAQRTESEKTGSFTITNRPDSGLAGEWALDTFTRTITVTKIESPAAKSTTEVEAWEYEIVGHDEGTFVTRGDKTPGGVSVDEELFAGRTGKIVGDWSTTFVAPANWLGWLGGGDPNRNDKSTSEWIKSLWADGYQPGEFTDWKWTYTLCEDKWVNASQANGGNDGDIHEDSECPTPGPSVTASADPTPSASTSTAAPAPSVSKSLVAGGGPSLPVTGTPTYLVAGVGVLLVAAGVAALVLSRRRRAEFEAE